MPIHCHAVTLTFDPLTLKVRWTSSVTWSKSVRNLSEIEQFPAKLLIIWRIFAHVMSCSDLTFDLLTFNFYSTSGVMRLNSTKFDRNRIILLWVTDDDLARFRCAILGWGTTDKRFSKVRGPAKFRTFWPPPPWKLMEAGRDLYTNFIKPGEDI